MHWHTAFNLCMKLMLCISKYCFLFSLAVNGLDPLGGKDSSERNKFYVVMCNLKPEVTKSDPKVSMERRHTEMKSVLFAHYDNLEKYDVMNHYESLDAAQAIEKVWSMKFLYAKHVLGFYFTQLNKISIFITYYSPQNLGMGQVQNCG